MARGAATGESVVAGLEAVDLEAVDRDAVDRADVDRMDWGRAEATRRMQRLHPPDLKAWVPRACSTMTVALRVRQKRMPPAQAILSNRRFDSKVWQRATAVVVNTDGGKRRSSCRRFLST